MFLTSCESVAWREARRRRRSAAKMGGRNRQLMTTVSLIILLKKPFLFELCGKYVHRFVTIDITTYFPLDVSVTAARLRRRLRRTRNEREVFRNRCPQTEEERRNSRIAERNARKKFVAATE